MDSKSISTSILYGSWLNHQDPIFKRMFSYTSKMYVKYNKTSRFKLFHNYEDGNLNLVDYQHDLICIGMAKFKHAKTTFEPFYLFASFTNSNYFDGFSCCVEDKFSNYSFDKLIEKGYLDCPYKEISEDMTKQFFNNFKFA